jgi:hypothetical protein
LTPVNLPEFGDVITPEGSSKEVDNLDRTDDRQSQTESVIGFRACGSIDANSCFQAPVFFRSAQQKTA